LRKFVAILFAALLLAALASCGSEVDKKNGRELEKEASERITTGLNRNQPVPEFNQSQVRQNLIDIVTMQAEATATTSFFFLEGIGVIDSCPSIGFPIASTTQLTNPEQMNTSYQNPYTIPQIEPTGVYSPPDSSGTYVICVNNEGVPYANYWEGYVKVVSGPAEWDGETIVLTGKPTGNINNGEN
jgi:hypothetical protein